MAPGGRLDGPSGPLVAFSREAAWSETRTKLEAAWSETRPHVPREYMPDLVCPLFDDPARTGATWIQVSPPGARTAELCQQLPLAGDPEAGWYVFRASDGVTHILHGPSVAAKMFKDRTG